MPTPITPRRISLIQKLKEVFEAGLHIMIDDHHVPAATVVRLIEPEPPGGRHDEAKTIATALCCQGMSLASIYRLLTAAYPAPDFQEDIDGLVTWVAENGPVGKPCRLPRVALEDVDRVVEFATEDYPELAALREDRPTARGNASGRAAHGLVRREKKAPLAEAKRAVRSLLSGSIPNICPDEFIAASPVALNPDWRARSAQFFASVYPEVPIRQGEPATSPLINVVFRHYQKANGKSVPFGGGVTFPARDWYKAAQTKYLVSDDFRDGLLFRVNPVKGDSGRGSGSGKNGAYEDTDVVARARMYLLVENDDLPMRWQLAFWWHFRSYVVALTSSGGRSLHALLVILGYDLQNYRNGSRALTNFLRPYGFDATENASRLSRLPGVTRTSKANPTDPYRLAGKQELLWLNPEAALAYKLIINHRKNHEEPSNETTPAGA